MHGSGVGCMSTIGPPSGVLSLLKSQRRINAPILNAMDKATIVKSVQAELMKHGWDTFTDEPPSVAKGGKGVVVTGCSECKIRLNTTNQYLRHLLEEVLPRALGRALDDAKQ